MASPFTVLQYDGDNSALQYHDGGAFHNIVTTTAAAGSDTQVQYNSSGAFAGSANLTYNGTTLTTPTVTLATLIGSATHNLIKPAADAVNAFNITMADGTTSILSVDSLNRRIGIGTATPAKALDVNGNVNIAGVIAMGPTNASGACLIDMVNPFVGLGVPAMTSAQKTAISPARAGNIVFDTDLGKLCVNNGAAWETITSA